MKDHNKSIFLVLVSLLFLIVLPGMAFAQPLQCCKLSSNIEFDGQTFNSGIWLGENRNTDCDGDGSNDVPNTTCSPTAATIASSCATPKWGIICLLNSVVTITNWIFYILVVVTGLLVILGGFTIATAGGDPSKVDSGKNYILYAMVGLAVALLSRAIPAVVKALI